MGKISDLLEKSGVEYGAKRADSDSVLDRTAGNLDSPAEETVAKRESSSEVAAREPVATKTAPPPPRPTLSSSEAWDERLLKVTHSSSEAAESFRILRSRILYPQDGRPRPKSVLVTSSSPQEGKSFVSANLAVSIARGLDQFALLVDCDLRRPSLARLFGLSSICRRGLADYLRDDCDVSELIHKTSIEKLSLLASGDSPVNPAELLSSVRMSGLVDELSNRYHDRLIIFDTPPYQIASETNVLAQVVDGIVLVVGYGKSDKSHIKTMVDQIGRDKIFGVVFNGMKDSYIQKKVFSYGYSGGYYGEDEAD
ncbi:MAG: polysaccharide biosynthesis tyrosine autokinase [Deltaproteobacteria bacterium]|nr:polysaccharide biosynthesis tyrosine autokinase [Deltaproteobacteria bacterium]